MSNLRRVLERQHKEEEEIRRRRADEDREGDEEKEEMLAATGQKSIILEAVALFDCWVWHAFFGVAGSQNDLNVLVQSLVFNEVLRGHSPQITYQINNIVYFGAYYLADGIYPRWTTFVKTISNPQSEKETSFAAFQEGYMKDVERCFGILQARSAIIRGAARMLDDEVLRSIMMTCIILHNMIMEDEYDYDAPEVFEPVPMNTALTGIYERLMGPNGQPIELEPLLRDGRYNNPMINRYQEMQSSYVHEKRQLDLIEHLWEMKGNHSGCTFLPIGLDGRGSGDSISIEESNGESVDGESWSGVSFNTTAGPVGIILNLEQSFTTSQHS
ncbi:unnamed protein product [Prunus brigantina]